MKILVLGGTRFFGVHMVKDLIAKGHEVTIATRGKAKDTFGNAVKRITVERTDADSMKNAFSGMRFDVVIDKIAYCSNDIKYAMEAIDSDKYIYMSTASVYDVWHMDMKEEAFDGKEGELVWCNRADFTYDVIKANAERALCQKYSDKKWIAVRYPFVIGEDDYTKRLYFYIEHTMKSLPMYVDNMDCQMGFIRSDEAGEFMSFLVDKDFTGAINGCSVGTISLKEIIQYVEKQTGIKAVLSKDGDVAPYNQAPDYSVNVDKAKRLGYQFTDIKDWIYELVDSYIRLIKSTK